MAYCRRSDADSDLYVLHSNYGYECLCCPLAPEEDYSGIVINGSFTFETLDELHAHLMEHERQGHKVPRSAVERIRAEMRGEVYVDPETRLEALLWTLSAPNRVMEHLTRSARIIELIDAVEDCLDMGNDDLWELYDALKDEIPHFLDEHAEEREERDHWYESELWNKP